MAPLIVLIVVTLVARAVGAKGLDYVESWPSALAVGLGAMFILTGLSHFSPQRRAGLIAIVPPRLPRPEMLVTFTGVMELLGAGLLLVPWSAGPFRTLGAVGLALLLVAMFPANVYAAGAKRSPHSPHTSFVARSAMQCVFLASALAVAIFR